MVQFQASHHEFGQLLKIWLGRSKMMLDFLPVVHHIELVHEHLEGVQSLIRVFHNDLLSFSLAELIIVVVI